MVALEHLGVVQQAAVWLVDVLKIPKHDRLFVANSEVLRSWKFYGTKGPHATTQYPITDAHLS